MSVKRRFGLTSLELVTIVEIYWPKMIDAGMGGGLTVPIIDLV